MIISIQIKKILIVIQCNIKLNNYFKRNKSIMSSEDLISKIDELILQIKNSQKKRISNERSNRMESKIEKVYNVNANGRS